MHGSGAAGVGVATVSAAVVSVLDSSSMGYLILFCDLEHLIIHCLIIVVWFISFSIFPENQIIKIDVGDVSPTSFFAPNYIEIIDEEQTAINKELAIESVSPIYSIDTTINDSVIKGIKDMFLAVFEARVSETLVVGDSEVIGEEEEPEVEIVTLSKVEQIENIVHG